MRESVSDRKPKILVVEDNAAFSKMLKMRLESAGYETVITQDGLEGLNMARREKPDLVLLDLLLPGMNGHKVCRLLKSDWKYKHIPVLVLTGRNLDKDRELAKSCGADGFALKTVRSSVLLDAIKRLLEVGTRG